MKRLILMIFCDSLEFAGGEIRAGFCDNMRVLFALLTI